MEEGTAYRAAPRAAFGHHDARRVAALDERIIVAC
jgi:hypothetical protein